jgi:hypothetical protein
MESMLAFFPFSFINIPVMPDSLSSFQKILFGIMILTFLTLWSFIDIVGHFIILYLIDHRKIEAKYPKLKPLLNYFKKTNYLFLGIEIVFVISIYLMLIGICISVFFIN